MNLRNRYRFSLIAFSLYTCYQCYQGLKMHRLIGAVRDLGQAQNLLSVDGYWLLSSVNQLIGSVRSLSDALRVGLGLISPSYVLIIALMVVMFYRQKGFKAVMIMVMVPWVTTLLMVLPLLVGLIRMEVIQTIHNVVLMANLGSALYLVFLVGTFIYAVLIGCDFVEVGATFNYNKLERGDCDVRNDE